MRTGISSWSQVLDPNEACFALVNFNARPSELRGVERCLAFIIHANVDNTNRHRPIIAVRSIVPHLMQRRPPASRPAGRHGRPTALPTEGATDRPTDRDSLSVHRSAPSWSVPIDIHQEGPRWHLNGVRSQPRPSFWPWGGWAPLWTPLNPTLARIRPDQVGIEYSGTAAADWSTSANSLVSRRRMWHIHRWIHIVTTHCLEQSPADLYDYDIFRVCIYIANKQLLGVVEQWRLRWCDQQQYPKETTKHCRQ